MSKDCNFQQLTANQYPDKAVCDAFISGLLSNAIRQSLLENKTRNLETAFDETRALDSARKSSDSYRPSPTPNVATTSLSTEEVSSDSDVNKSAAAAATNKRKRYFCVLKLHLRTRRPARDATCSKCQKVGHYQRVCRSRVSASTSPSATTSALQTATHTLMHTSLISKGLTKSCVSVVVNGEVANALIDSVIKYG